MVKSPSTSNGTFSITNGATNYLERNVLRCSLRIRWCADAIRFQSVADPERQLHLLNVIALSLIARAFDRAMSLSFTDVSPSAAIVPGTGTLRSFTSDVSGDFSSTVPEPSTWAMMLFWLARGFGYVGFRKAPRPIGNLDRLIANRYLKRPLSGGLFPFRALKNSTSSRAGAVDSKTLVT